MPMEGRGSRPSKRGREPVQKTFFLVPVCNNFLIRSFLDHLRKGGEAETWSAPNAGSGEAEVACVKRYFFGIQSWPLICAQPKKPKITPKKGGIVPRAYNLKMCARLCPYLTTHLRQMGGGFCATRLLYFAQFRAMQTCARDSLGVEIDTSKLGS